MHRNTQAVIDAAADKGLQIEVRQFPEGTRTAQDAANAIGCEVGAIAKSIVLMADDGPVLVLTSGANRADYTKVAAALDTAGVRRANADEARAATGFPIGGTAPWPHPQPLRMLCDLDLLAYDVAWAAAGTPDTVFAITPADLVRIAGATPADVAERAG